MQTSTPWATLLQNDPSFLWNATGPQADSPKTLQHESSNPRLAPGTSFRPVSSSLPGASGVSLVDMIGAVCAPVGQHLGVSWGDRGRRSCRESRYWSVVGKGIIWGQGVGVTLGCMPSRRNLEMCPSVQRRRCRAQV